MKLVLGVVDLPYTDHTQSETTGEVAEILEEKYHVMETFFDMHKKDIADAIGQSVAGALVNARAGQTMKRDIFLSAMDKTEKMFKRYIDSEQHGIKLKKHDAPKAGARKKRQYKKVSAVVAFVDSGLMRKSFKSWIVTT